MTSYQTTLGKQGIGLGKRARSPDASERRAKIAKMAEQADHRDFRERAREGYHNRLAEGRLGTSTVVDPRVQRFTQLFHPVH